MTEPERRSEDRGFRLVHEDDLLLVVAKAAGLAVHPGQEPDSVTTLLGGGLQPVHRLDRETSGVLVLAKTRDAASFLGRCFAEGRVEKRYLALVAGITHDKGVIRRPLVTDGQPQDAVTRYRTLASFREGLRASLLLVRPATGRQHQIRRHLAGLGHPVLGDHRHGDPEANRRAARLLGDLRLWLHAAAITLPHPADGQKRTWWAGLPEELIEMLEGLEAPERVLRPYARQPASPSVLDPGSSGTADGSAAAGRASLAPGERSPIQRTGWPSTRSS